MYLTYQTEQPTEARSYKGTQINFISTDFPDCHSLFEHPPPCLFDTDPLKTGIRWQNE